MKDSLHCLLHCICQSVVGEGTAVPRCHYRMIMHEMTMAQDPPSASLSTSLGDTTAG